MSENHTASFLMQYEPWQKDANCKGADPRIFIPDQGITTAEAKRFCLGCEVRKECEDYARRTHSVGVFGGKLFTFRYSDPVELMPVRRIQDSRPYKVRVATRAGTPSILGKAASFSKPSILGR